MLKILGVVEVKSMTVPTRRLLDQINKHVIRLGGRLKLAEKEWSSGNLLFAPFTTAKRNEPDLIRVMVLPSTWKLSREWRSVETKGHKTMVFPELSKPPIQTEAEELEPNFWKITLAWSQEALNQAAYEMPFWYMAHGRRSAGYIDSIYNPSSEGEIRESE